jgi:hypothetical protein
MRAFLVLACAACLVAAEICSPLGNDCWGADYYGDCNLNLDGCQNACVAQPGGGAKCTANGVAGILPQTHRAPSGDVYKTCPQFECYVLTYSFDPSDLYGNAGLCSSSIYCGKCCEYIRLDGCVPSGPPPMPARPAVNNSELPRCKPRKNTVSSADIAEISAEIVFAAIILLLVSPYM